MDLSGIISAYAMIKAFVYSSKIVINDSLSVCKDPLNGINYAAGRSCRLHGKIGLEFNKIFITRISGLTKAV